MPIITFSKKQRVPIESYYTQWPDQFVSQNQRESDDYIKNTLDYFYTVALQQYNNNCKTYSHNYRLVKGILRREDFYENPESFSLIENLTRDEGLPEDIQHYSIFNPVLNTMVGEMSRRPDNAFVKAFDDDSKSEELEFKTDILNQYIMQTVQQKIYQQMIQQGVDMESPEAQQQYSALSEEKLTEYLTSYTSQAERWGSRQLEALKMEFNMKELSEEAFRDLLISGRERFHILEDNSKTGFRVECVNPKNTWYLSTPDKKYIKDSFAAGIIEIMEISEIIQKLNLTKQEIDHLRKKSKQGYLVSPRSSNLFNNKTGIDSVTYDTYDPLILQQRLEAEERIMKDVLDEHLGIVNNVSGFGDKFVVITSYFTLKTKVGKLTYINIDGIEETSLVDENYKSGQHPNQLDLEWGWVDQWYKGLKVGDDVYYLEPFRLFDYCPLIGVDFEKRNTEVKSLIDLMKPFQAIYNVCCNQAWRILQKEKGVQFVMNPRKIPVPKDGTEEDALEILQYQMDELGMIFEDDSPENMQAPSSNTQVARAINLTRTQELQSRIQIGQWAKQEAWELVGINRERLGGTLATQTATGAAANLSQSYSQTEPWFVQHEYVLNQLYQGILDAALNIQSKNPVSTISYTTNEGENAWVQVNGSDLSMRDLRVFITSRAEDQRIFQETKQLAQAMLQNGAMPSAIAELMATKSVTRMKDVLKKVDKKNEQERARQMQIQEQQIQAQQEAVQMQIQAQQQKDAEDRNFTNFQNDKANATKIQVAALNAAGRNQEVLTDDNNNGTADSIEATRLNTDILSANRSYEMENQKIQAEYQNQQAKNMNEQMKLEYQKNKDQEDRKIKEKELQLKEKDIETKLKIAKANKNSYDK